MEPPSVPLQIGMKYENTQSRDKRLPNENGIFFKIYKSNSLYNELNEVFISGIVYSKTLPFLFEVGWIDLLAWLVHSMIPIHDPNQCIMDFWCYVYS